MGSNLVDEIDCGSFFDHIDDLIEFPLENECGGGFNSTDCKDLSIWNDPLPLPDSDSLFSGSHRDSASDLSAELSVPYEDIVQLEWLSTFVEDSFSGGGLTLPKESVPLNKEPSPSQGKFQTSSPVSVLESSSSSSSSSSSCSVEKTVLLTSPCHRGPQRARTKRPRPATFIPHTAIQLIAPTSSSFTETPKPFVAPRVSSQSENFAESPEKKKKKIKLSFPRAPIETNQNLAVSVRKCQHCEITKTPQWRAGPMGPKTLCNACGVRYKSGRLFPEYRPAASPTFIPSLHSNSHKKVVEMRSKVIPENNATATTKPEFNPSKEEPVDEEYK